MYQKKYDIKVIAITLFFLCLAISCDKQDYRKPITHVRYREQVHTWPEQIQSKKDVSQSTPLVTWSLPAGWKDLGSSQFRFANFAMENATELSLSLAQGSIEENINRWRKQFGVEPVSSDQISQLPQVMVLDKSSLLVEMQGNFTTMSGELKNDYMMKAIICLLDNNQGSLFIKLVGPMVEVQHQLENFELFYQSLKWNKSNASSMKEAQKISSSAGLTWTLPDHWQANNASGMRLVTFTIPGKTNWECYMTEIDGDAGGVLANINRWYKQMSAQPLTEQELSLLETLDVLNQKVSLVDLQGDFSGMSGNVQKDFALIGVVLPLKEKTMFIKMTGFMQDVQEQKSFFVQFCQSLRMS